MPTKKAVLSDGIHVQAKRLVAGAGFEPAGA